MKYIAYNEVVEQGWCNREWFVRFFASKIPYIKYVKMNKLTHKKCVKKIT